MSTQTVTVGQDFAGQDVSASSLGTYAAHGRLFTALLSVFLLSGPLKLTLGAFGIATPLDLTLILAICLTPYVAFGRRLKVKDAGVITLICVFMIYYAIRSLSQYSGVYAQEKLIYSSLNFFALLAVLRGNDFNPRTAFWIFIVIGLSFFMLVLASLRFGFLESLISLLPVADPVALVAEFRGGYLTCALILTVAVLLFKVAYPERAFFPISIVIGFLCFMIGARGPILFFALVLLMMSIVNARRVTFLQQKISVKNVLLAVMMLIILVVSFPSGSDTAEIFGRSMDRFSNLSNFSGESIDVRVDQLQFVWASAQSLSDVVIGHGTGSFGVLYAQMDTRMYPHNFLAELFFETGVIGLVMVVLVLSICIRGSIGKEGIWWVVLLIFLNAMKTYAFEDLRLLFAFAALTFMYRPRTNVREQLS